MIYLKIFFWLMLFTVFYAYIGYGILILLITKTRRLFGLNRRRPSQEPDAEPAVTLFIAAYNERDVVAEKMKNTYELDYPRNKLHILWVTDGSDDGTPELLSGYEGVRVLHQPKRNGKIGAMNRGMKFVRTPIVVFCDANTILNASSIRRIVNLFSDPVVGCVSGEKRILAPGRASAAGAGEGLYWRYESTLKRLDAELYSVAGAAGELFAIRTGLYKEMERDTLLDDFMISLRVAQQGYTIQYDPEAYAIEAPSANVKEELKRKIRISAGGLQSVIRLRSLLNIFRYGTLSFQYFSHRVLRWTLAPLSLLLLIPASGILAMNERISGLGIYTTLWWLQVVFYMAALIGWYLENHLVRVKILFVPYYFFIMNLSVFLGFRRLVRGSQSVNWVRAKRSGN
ncbi:MAG: glycosyltransferase family 2 protein [Bacteroidetes bacterium]|nr:glycosyltransferase family 2 protein [Bacteroidota bacterium]